VEAVGLLAGTGWASGVNLYAVVLLLGVLTRSGTFAGPELFGRTEVLAVAGVLYAVEFVVDKIPYVDDAWDAIHTVIRPLGAAVVGAVLAGEIETTSQVLSALGSGGLALASHAAKATARAAINTSPEPVSNVVVSVAEDGLVAGVVVLALANPVLALVAVAVLLVVGTVLVVTLWRVAGRAIRRRRARRRAG
jgi:hypothetical protein